MMRSNVVHNQFRANEDEGTIWDKQVCVAVWRIELAEFAIVDATKNHWLPRVDQKLLKFREAV